MSFRSIRFFDRAANFNEEVTVEQNPATVADQRVRVEFWRGTTICCKDRWSDSEVCNIKHLNEWFAMMWLDCDGGSVVDFVVEKSSQIYHLQ